MSYSYTLSFESKKIAPEFFKLLKSNKNLTIVEENLKTLGFRVDYLEDYGNRRYGAVFLDKIRLIDNITTNALFQLMRNNHMSSIHGLNSVGLSILEEKLGYNYTVNSEPTVRENVEYTMAIIEICLNGFQIVNIANRDEYNMINYLNNFKMKLHELVNTIHI